MGPGSHWEGRRGHERLQGSTIPSASGVDQLQLHVMCRLLKDMFCGCCPKLYFCRHNTAASSSLRVHGGRTSCSTQRQQCLKALHSESTMAQSQNA